jgi:hypothetical protein
VRKDLSPPQIAVQSAHAAIEIARSHISPDLEHPSVIICGIDSESKLQHHLDHYRSLGIVCKPFYESDLDGQLTAFATEPIASDQRRPFKRLQLLKNSHLMAEGGVV